MNQVETKQVIVGTAGHIDHGKTALIRYLTGIDTDRLKEEKERGITIDLGFAHLNLAQGVHLGIVDVPGPERVVKNMLAGAGGIDLVLLVIAADEGVMPQTREHLAICELLGIQEGLVALTKADTVDQDWLELVTEDVVSFLQGTFLEGCPIVPVSSVTGEGISDLLDVLGAVAARVNPKSADGAFRMPIDRVFSMRGFGTVVTGTLISGTIAVDESVEIFPKGIVSRVRGIQTHNRAAPSARAGQRTALNLAGVETDAIRRGDVLGAPGELMNTTALDVRLQYLADAEKPLKNRSRVRLHLGTEEAMGRVILLDANELEPGGTCLAQIVAEKPVVAVPGDRFVIRQYSPLITIGGGKVLDIAPLRHRRFQEDDLKQLRRLEEGSAAEALAVYLENAGADGLRWKGVRQRSSLAEPQLLALLERLVSEGEARLLDGEQRWWVHSGAMEQLRRAIGAQVADYHKANPLLPGMPREELRSKNSGLDERVFAFVLDQLGQEGVLVIERDRVRLASHRVKLDSDQANARKILEESFLDGGFQPPHPATVAGEHPVLMRQWRDLVQVLVDEGVLVRLKGDLYYHREHLEEIERRLREYLTEHETIAASTFRDLLGITRKHAIPLLEFFDARKVTVRTGDLRRLRTS